MNIRERNKMAMYMDVDSVLAQFLDEMSFMPAFIKAWVEFRTSINDIKRCNTEFQHALSGASAAQNDLSNELINQAIRISNALYVLAIRSDDDKLKAGILIDESKFYQIRDTVLHFHCSNIAELAKIHEKRLTDFGIMKEVLQKFDALIHDFALRLSKRRETPVENKAAFALASTFDRTDEILREEIDRLMEIVRRNNLFFYNQYQAARVIKDRGNLDRPKTGPHFIAEFRQMFNFNRAKCVV